MSVVNTYNLFLNSKQRDSGTSNEFRINLLKPIGLTNPNNWFSVRIGSAEIPYIFQLINNSNSTINFTVVRGGNTHNGTLILEHGNYNILSLLTEFKQKLTTAVQTLTGYTPTFLFTYTRTTGKCTLAQQPTNGDIIGCNITIHNNSPIFMTCIGFDASFIITFTTSAVSTQNVNVSQNNAVYIRSDSLIQTSNFESIVEKSNISDILAKIQVNTLPQTFIIWTNPSDLEVVINNRVIDTVSLYLSSSLSYELSLQNLDWQCRMTIKEYTNLPSNEQLRTIASASASNGLHLNSSDQTGVDEETRSALAQRSELINTLQNLKNKMSKKLKNKDAV